MKCISRYEKYKEDPFDRYIVLIKNGKIRSGRYSHLVKIDQNKKLEGKEFFTDGDNNQRE
jgi:hypothetical protein